MRCSPGLIRIPGDTQIRGMLRQRLHNPVLGEIALDGRTAEVPRPFEARQVLRFGVRDVDIPVDGVDRHVEVDGADVREAGGFVERCGVDLEYVEVRKKEADAVAPVAPTVVAPLPGAFVKLND